MADEYNASGRVFSSEVVAIINRAYEGAVGDLAMQTAHSDQRAALAKCVMDLARGGETDEVKLREGAVAALKRIERVKARARLIWKAEGMPDGRHEHHWVLAEQQEGGGQRAADSPAQNV